MTSAPRRVRRTAADATAVAALIQGPAEPGDAGPNAPADERGTQADEPGTTATEPDTPAADRVFKAARKTGRPDQGEDVTRTEDGAAGGAGAAAKVPEAV
ncbi:hypothetical protein ACWGDX_17920 [Streptomyces sp. NPDC055025]